MHDLFGQHSRNTSSSGSTTVHHCKTVYTDVFHVYSAKRFPGLEDSTELSKSFASQGLKIRIKGGAA